MQLGLLIFGGYGIYIMANAERKERAYLTPDDWQQNVTLPICEGSKQIARQNSCHKNLARTVAW